MDASDALAALEQIAADYENKAAQVRYAIDLISGKPSSPQVHAAAVTVTAPTAKHYKPSAQPKTDRRIVSADQIEWNINRAIDALKIEGGPLSIGALYQRVRLKDSTRVLKFDKFRHELWAAVERGAILRRGVRAACRYFLPGTPGKEEPQGGGSVRSDATLGAVAGY